MMIQHVGFLAIVFYMVSTIFFFNPARGPSQVLMDVLILSLCNLFFCLYFLEVNLRRYRFKNMFLLVLSAVTVLAALSRLIPLPFGLTLGFLIPLISASVFGGLFGFLVGQWSMLISGIFLGGLGPWIPYQMLLMGIGAYYAGILCRKGNRICLSLYVAALSFVYGYLMTVTVWPIVMRESIVPNEWTQRWTSFNYFYLTTSLVWDSSRAIGSALIFWMLTTPISEILYRGHRRLIVTEDRERN